ncbi:matrix-remodeling-associated protein 5-like [Sinocyclocheilus grahami]|uniref:matrix-remodeling-associated protein 5-like n=1 Tax=Sinocyclocheilus grahami TaxID=75366 RepID=UPI0007AD0891|nr:PREDICTED: matrix-remodeling-associated protein 5-like [Sinocyclocheilus grahami]
MAPVGVPALLLLASCLLFILPSCLYACPRSCSCPSPKEVHCTFRHLPSAPQNLPKDTERLNLGYNSIGTVGSSDFANLRQLEMLMLHGNDISSVSSGSFYHLRSLQILKLSYNKLKRVDPSLFEGLTSLVRLHLDHNLIDFIEPFSFTGLTSLKLLQLEGNRLQDLHSHTFITVSVLGTFWSSGLRHLHLADNQLEYLLPGTLQHLDRLEVLSLHGNPWACDCHLHWLLEWDKNHEGVIKCKKDRESGDAGNCAACASPKPLNNSQILQLSTSQLTCYQPSLQSPLKIGESSMWENQEPDAPYIKDLEHPLGHLTFILSDSHGNRAHVACNVTRPVEDTSMVWEPVRRTDEIAVNVTLRTLLECEIDRDALQNLWRLVAYYYESPAILERGTRLGNSSKVTFQYSQASHEESPYFTELKGHLMAEPAWLLQPRVTLQLNRRKTTTKKLVLNFSTFISKHIIGRGDEEDVVSSWAMIQRGAPGRIQSVLEHSEVRLDCSVLSSGHPPVEWMLPDLTTVDQTDSHKLRLENYRLVIKNTSIADSGLYHCFVRTDTNVDIVPYRLTVRMRLLSPSDLNGKKISVEKGDTLSLPCLVTSPHPIETRWFLPNNHIFKASDMKGRVYVSQNNTLIIKKVTYEDAGEYSCLAANLYGADMLSHLIVVVGEKEDAQRGVTVSMGELLLFENEDSEGSGYEEIKRPTTKLTPQRVDGKHVRQNSKGKKIKESVRKPNNAVKELDPGRWEQILAKANAKLSTMSPVTAHLEMTKTMTESSLITTNKTLLAATFKMTKTDVTASSTSASSSIQHFNAEQLEPPPLNEHVQETTQVEKSKDKTSDYNISYLTLEHIDSTTVPEHETQLIKQVDRQTIEEKIRANNNSIWNQRRRFPYRQRRPPSRRPRPKRPNFTLAPSTAVPFTHSPVKTLIPKSSVAMTTNSYTQAQNKDVTALMTLEVSPAHYPVTERFAMAVTEDPLKVPITMFRKDENLNELESKTKHIESVQLVSTTSLQENEAVPATRATPRQINRYGHENREIILRTNSQANENKTRQILTTAIPNLQISYINPPETKIAHVTEKPTLTNVDQQRVYNWAMHPEGVPIHPWLIQKSTPKKQISITPHPYNQFPFWPTVHSSKHHHSQDKTWYFLQTGGRGAGATNRPEITAQTAKPTTYILGSVTASVARTIAPHVSSSRVRDHLLFNRLRNRYRQSQLDAYRLAQMGKLVTSKPRTYRPTPQPHQAPNIPNIYKPVTPPSILAYTNKPTFTASVPYGSRWHYSQFGAKKLSTAIPFPNLMGNGAKPRITTTESVTISALAETDVLLSCRSSGDPKPNVSWTKVSTGYCPQRHITAFPNGTLRILRLTEKDGGNYLCMYQRPNGEDMELFQVEVLMRPPKIENTGAQHKRVANGDNFLVDCVASGLPDPEVSWSLPDGTMINNALQSDDSGTRNRRYIIFGNGTLLLQQMGKKDEGNYTCYAKNTLGEDAMKVSVQVMPNSPQITSKEQVSMWAPFGQSAQMKCDATGVLSATIIWISPRNEIIPSSSVKYQILNDGTLIIKKLTLADQGKYACVARNPAGDNIKNVNLLVEVKGPQINGHSGRSENKLLAVYYQTLLLDCKAEGKPVPQITWTTPYGMSLPTPYLGGRFQVHRNGTLELRGIRKTDEGRFLCIAKNYLGEASVAVDLKVASLAEKPSFPVPNIEVLPLKADGDDISLECRATGKPKPVFLWILPNGTALNPGMKLRRFIHYLGNGTLHITQPGVIDKGVYRCLAKNVAGQAEKRYALEPGQKPQIRSTASTMKISFGQTVNMPCNADGWPQAKITWTLPNGLVLDKPQIIGRVTYLSNGTLQVKETSKFDRGTYTCKATNTFGSSTLSYPVSIMVFPPQITHAPPSVTRVNRGSPVILTCIAAGIPKPDISWTLPGRTTLVPNSRFTAQGGIRMTEEGNLVIQDPGLMNSGIYKCNARNALGTDFKATYLQVI